MGNERLSVLLVVAVESDVEAKINLEEAVDTFAKIKYRRIALIAQYPNLIDKVIFFFFNILYYF